MATVRILLVEDEESHSKPFSELLRFHGYEIRCAKNLTDTREVLRSFTPLLAIVDLLLISADDSDGFDVIRYLRASEHAHLGILAWTANYVSARDEVLALRAGADDFVKKDADVGLIEARIDALIRRIGR